MKRLLCVFLCLLALTASALALEDDFTYWDGDELLTGMEARRAAEQAALNASQPEPEPAYEPEPEPTHEPEPEPIPEPEPEISSIENAGEKNETASIPPLAADNDDKYPVGSYIDPAGNIWSASGELLSPGTTPATEPAAEISPPLVESSVYTVADLRSPADSSGDPLVGLKALIVSIFGEYTPVTTTAAVTETVNGETTTTLVDVVAEGAAGVDYEWIAGVFLFGLLLFCMMKLLGGVVK